MKRLGIQQEEIEATEVIIKTKDKEIIVSQPQVAKVNLMGQETFQVSGHITERSLEKFTEEDIRTVVAQAKCSEEEAKNALNQAQGDLAEAILLLGSK